MELVDALVVRWVPIAGATGRRWAHWARNKRLSGGSSVRRFPTSSGAADQSSSTSRWHAVSVGFSAIPVASAAVGGPERRHLLLRGPAAHPGAHDGANLR